MYIGSGVTIRKNDILLKIQGSPYTVFYWGENKVKIGCKIHSIGEWLGNKGKELAKEYNFNEIQINEYKLHLQYIKKLHNLKNMENKN